MSEEVESTPEQEPASQTVRESIAAALATNEPREPEPAPEPEPLAAE